MTLIVRTFRGAAREHHDRLIPSPATPELWVFEVDRPAIVLGSRQGLDVVDADACRRAGVEVVRRRSGGGAVLVEPDAMTWVDVIVPAGDERWNDDVVASMRWCGERWRQALLSLGAGSESTLRVCQSSVAASPVADRERADRLAELVCFASVAAGEVTSTGAKLVGISQRRTRQAARFQCSVHHSWAPRRLWRLLTAPRPRQASLEALPVAVVDTSLRAALLDAVAASFAA